MSETNSVKPQEPQQPNPWNWALAGALVAGLVVGGAMWLVGRRNSDFYLQQIAARDLAIRELQNSVTQSMNLSMSQGESLKKLRPYRDVMAALEAKRVDIVELGVSSEVPEARGRIVHNIDAEHYFLVAKGLAPADETHEYALWLTDDAGRVFAGTFAPDAEALAVVMAAPPRKVDATAFEVTLEKKGEAEKHAGRIFLTGKAAK